MSEVKIAPPLRKSAPPLAPLLREAWGRLVALGVLFAAVALMLVRPALFEPDDD